MDSRRFDSLIRALAAPKTRRGFLGTLAALGAGLLGARATRAQVTQVQCGNKLCAASPAVCTNGCVCCIWSNGNNRCVPPGTCTGSVATTTTAAPTTTTTTTTTAAPSCLALGCGGCDTCAAIDGANVCMSVGSNINCTATCETSADCTDPSQPACYTSFYRYLNDLCVPPGEGRCGSVIVCVP